MGLPPDHARRGLTSLNAGLPSRRSGSPYLTTEGSPSEPPYDAYPETNQLLWTRFWLLRTQPLRRYHPCTRLVDFEIASSKVKRITVHKPYPATITSQ